MSRSLASPASNCITSRLADRLASTSRASSPGPRSATGAAALTAAIFAWVVTRAASKEARRGAIRSVEDSARSAVTAAITPSLQRRAASAVLAAATCTFALSISGFRKPATLALAVDLASMPLTVSTHDFSVARSLTAAASSVALAAT